MTGSSHALVFTGPESTIFDLAETLGFETEFEAQSLSVFEQSPNLFMLEALFRTSDEARACLNNLEVPAGVHADIRELPDEDWVAKSQAGLPPVYAGRFCVFGAHSQSEIPNNVPFPIQIEAGAAFGTGHHGTTQGCLLIWDEWLSDGFKPDSVLDLGCGAGTLAIAAAMSLQIPVLATDIDQEAVYVTRENAALNQVGDWVQSETVDGFSAPVFRERTFDLVFANILAGPLMGLAPDIASHTSSGGRVILSGILDELADDVATTFEHSGFSIIKGPSLSGWTSLKGVLRP